MTGKDSTEKMDLSFLLTDRPWYIWLFSNAFFVAPIIMPAVQRYLELPVAAATITFLITLIVSLTVLVFFYSGGTGQLALAAVIRVAWLFTLISGTSWTLNLAAPVGFSDMPIIVLAALLSVPILILDTVFGYLYMRLVATVASPVWNLVGEHVIATFLISNSVGVIALTTLVYS